MCIRLGPANPQKTRALKVILNNKKQRNEIIENFRKIRNLQEHDLKRCIVTKDLTKKQREENKARRLKRTESRDRANPYRDDSTYNNTTIVSQPLLGTQEKHHGVSFARNQATDFQHVSSVLNSTSRYGTNHTPFKGMMQTNSFSPIVPRRSQGRQMSVDRGPYHRDSPMVRMDGLPNPSHNECIVGELREKTLPLTPLDSDDDETVIGGLVVEETDFDG